MEYLQLKNSDLNVSRLGFGCCPMGGHGWGMIDFKELETAVNIAINSGVNFFDTADIYGFGASEEFLGKVLRKIRTQVIIATKFGVRQTANGKTLYDNTPEYIGRALDESLKRLKTDYIDLYQIHYKDEATSWDEIFNCLGRKRDQGKIRYFGLSNISYNDIVNIKLPNEAVCFQSEYSLCNRSHEKDVLRIRKDKSLCFLSWGSLGQGVLSGKYGRGFSFENNDRRNRSIYANFHDNFDRNLALIDNLKRISKKCDRSLAQIAIRWIIEKLEFSVALVGIKSVSQITENIGAFDWHLATDDFEFLDNFSLSLK